MSELDQALAVTAEVGRTEVEGFDLLFPAFAEAKRRDANGRQAHVAFASGLEDGTLELIFSLAVFALQHAQHVGELVAVHVLASVIHDKMKEIAPRHLAAEAREQLAKRVAEVIARLRGR